jgi:hypothetical protein
VDKHDLDRLQRESPITVGSGLVEGIGDLLFSAGLKGGDRKSAVSIFFVCQSSRDRFIAFWT